MGLRARLVCLRSECDTATDIGYLRADGVYAAVRIADSSDAQTIAGQLQVLAAQIGRLPLDFSNRFNITRRREKG